MTVMAASLGGALILVLILVVVFLGTAYGLSRRGSGVDSHPSEDGPDGRPRDDEV